MADRRNGTLVYSTDAGRICPGCGWPARDCKCSKTAEQPVPARIVAKLRMEKKGRGGKTVTVVDGLPRNGAFLKDCVRSSSARAARAAPSPTGAIELQGDLRERVREVLLKKGLVVKG